MSGRARAAGVLAVVLLVAACSDPPAPSVPSTGAVASTSADPFDVSVGDCVSTTTGNEEVTAIPVVPCEQAHAGEVYAAVRMDGGPVFPGEQAVVEAARGCEQPFEAFVGIPLRDSTLMVTYFHPTEQSWATGDREILCVVSDPAGSLVGSLRGAAR